ncbi:MAG: hypothetical protein AAFZ18_06480 [Myxococcota bacterium]
MGLASATLLASLLGSGVLGLEGELRVSARGFAQSIPEEVLFSQLRTGTLASTTTADRLSLQLHGLGHLEGRPFRELGVRVGLDTGLVELATGFGDGVRVLIDGREAGTRFEETAFIGESWIELELGKNGVFELRLGKLRPRIGAGAIFDAYAFGARVDVDLSLVDALPIAFRAHALLPDGTFTDRSKQSPFFDLEVSVPVGRQGTVRFLGAILVDGDDGAATVLQDAVVRGGIEQLEALEAEIVPELRPAIQPAVERGFDRLAAGLERLSESTALYLISSSGWLGWLGSSFEASWPAFRIEGSALLGLGEVTLDITPDLVLEAFAENELGPIVSEVLADQSQSGPVSVLSGFAQLQAHFTVSSEVQLRAFGLAMTGDTGLFPSSDGARQYGSFVGLAPFLPYTSLFFQGGVAGALASPTVASPAPDGAGLLAAGLGCDAFPIEPVLVRASLSIMGSTVPSEATGGRVYGMEGDIAVDWLIAPGILASIDLAAFVPMDYYGDLDVGLQAIAGFTALWSASP